MLAYLLQVTICLFAFYTLYAVVFSRETFFSVNRWYLMGTLCISLVMPLLLKLPQALMNPDAETAFVYTLEPVAIGIQNFSASLKAEALTPLWIRIAIALYWIGVSLLFIRMLLGLRTILKMYLKGKRTKIAQGRSLIYSDQLHLPFSFFNWIFLSKQHEMSEQELQEILDHESAHCSALHSLDVMMMELACVFLWPSPMVYLYRKSLRHVHEYLADAVVLQRASVKHYGELLISQASNGMQIALANHFFQSQLKNRIIMMTKNKSHRIALGKYAVLLPVLMFVFALFAFRDGSANTNTLQPIFSIVQDSVPGEVFKVVDEMPRFPGCEDSGITGTDLDICSQGKLIEYVYTNLKYPVEAKEKGITGRSIVQFTVQHDGTLKDVSVIRSLGYGTDDAIFDLMSTMPKWRPGYQKGKAVNVQFTLPVAFQLPAAESSGEVFKVVEEMPRFPGCEDSGLTGQALTDCANEKLLAMIIQHTRYPEEAKNAGVEGTSVIQFIIRANGQITDGNVVRSIGYGTDAVMMDLFKVMQEMPEKWIPGRQGGRAVHVQFTLPMKFELPK